MQSPGGDAHDAAQGAADAVAEMVGPPMEASSTIVEAARAGGAVPEEAAEIAVEETTKHGGDDKTIHAAEEIASGADL